MKNWLDKLELDALERDRANFISQIIIDSLAPANTLICNPTAQKRLIDSEGRSLIKGLRNAYNDIMYNKGQISQVDKWPRKLGENVATSKGQVVHRTPMMELTQYAPTTEDVHVIPQLTIPLQINEMYIHDLSPEKSIVKWQVDNGIQTFVISWKNPAKSDGHWDMADYVAACSEAIDVISAITGTRKLNVSAGCSGGQTTAMLASRMAADGPARRLAARRPRAQTGPRRNHRGDADVAGQERGAKQDDQSAPLSRPGVHGAAFPHALWRAHRRQGRAHFPAQAAQPARLPVPVTGHARLDKRPGAAVHQD
jgi:hypothetical protein